MLEMAIYEYRCEANGRTVEVRHGMNEQLRTWGELADMAELDRDGTPADAPIERLMSAGVSMTGGSSSSPGPQSGPPCGSACGCDWN
jgi:predicted nucleic acid-binding Zn ribbon protein